MYLGTLGRLIEIKCPTSLQDSRSGGFTFATTLEGKVKAQALPGGRRVWDVELGQLTTPDDLQRLEQFAQGAWGAGPFVFVPADAPVTNVLPPRVASLDPAVLSAATAPDGPLLTPEGWAARSVSRTQTIGYFGTAHSPVVSGQPVTGAAYVLGADGGVRLYWYDRDGAQISWNTSPVRSTASEVVRSHVTALPPEGAVSCRLSFVFGAQAAWPTITWTDRLMPVSPGHGCDRAVVHGVSKDVVRATETQQLYSAGFTVTEVG